MTAVKIVLRSLMQHPFRTLLTAFGIAIALLSFVMIRTLINAWYSGVEGASRDRLVVRNSVSLVFYLPLAYQERIARVPGVETVVKGNWFGGLYREDKFDFANFAVDPEYFDIYPEFILDPEERKAYAADLRGALIGEEVANRFGIKVGQQIRLTGTIFPGLYDFVVRGILRKRDPAVDTRVMYFHWKYLNERNRESSARPADMVGFFAVKLAPGAGAADVSKRIDAEFANSYAETLTETETAFLQSFVSMSSTIILSLNVIAGIVILIVLLVVANTMVMSTRERLREYAILKALGFRGMKLFLLVTGESVALAVAGFLFLGLLLPPVFLGLQSTVMSELASFFPTFRLSPWLIAGAFGISCAVGVLAGIVPWLSVTRMNVVEAVRKGL